MKNRGAGYWMLLGPGWLLLAYLVWAQAIPAFDYELGVSMGTQEPAEQITAVGVAFWYGFALADLVVYIPLLMLGLIGYRLGRDWNHRVLASGLSRRYRCRTQCARVESSQRDRLLDCLTADHDLGSLGPVTVVRRVQTDVTVRRVILYLCLALCLGSCTYLKYAGVQAEYTRKRKLRQAGNSASTIRIPIFSIAKKWRHILRRVWTWSKTRYRCLEFKY